MATSEIDGSGVHSSAPRRTWRWGVTGGVVLALGALGACGSDDDSGVGDDGGGSGGSDVCVEIFAIGGDAPADTAAFVVESPGVAGEGIAGAVECVDDVGDTVFKTVIEFSCSDGRTVYYASLDDADYSAWEDGGTFFAVPVSPGPGESNLCV